MKIALVIKSLVIAKGGAERFSQNLIRGLKSKNHEITVFCHDWDEKAENLNINFVKIPPPRKFKHPWFDFSEKVNAAISKTGSFDIVFGLTQIFPQDVHRIGGGIYKHWYKRKYGILFPLQLLRPRVRKALAFERKIYSPQNFRQIITISEMDKKLLMQYYNVPSEKIHTVYNGFDMEVFHNKDRESARNLLCEKLRIPPENSIVLFAANNYVRKGLPQAVKALLASRKPENFSLVVIGKSKNSILKKLQKQIGNKFNSIWLDRVDNPADFYRGSDFLLFPTLYDSFANVIGEALLCGLPVITTAQAGGAEMIVHGESGFVASSANSLSELTSFAEKLADKKTCGEFSSRAGEKVSKLTIDFCAEQTEKILSM